MDRRAFLRCLGFGTIAAAAASITAFDVEKLLWMPNDKTILLPAAMGNVLVTPDWLADEVLRALTNNLHTAQFVRAYDDHLANVGSIVYARLPQRYR